MSYSFCGGLIQTAVGLAGGIRRLVRTKRSGLALNALVERALARGMNGIGLAVMHLIRCHQADPGMVMVLVVPGEEAAAEVIWRPRCSQSDWGKFRLVFQGLEMSFPRTGCHWMYGAGCAIWEGVRQERWILSNLK